MQSRSIPSVTLYIRITDEKGNRRYERVYRRNPQLSGGVYCLHLYENGKRKWATVGIDINARSKLVWRKESELLSRLIEATPSPATPKSLEELRGAFLHDRRTTRKRDGSPLDPDTIRSYELVTREFLEVIKRKLPSEITKQDLKDWRKTSGPSARRYEGAWVESGFQHRSCQLSRPSLLDRLHHSHS
jgi:hypothetical protein